MASSYDAQYLVQLTKYGFTPLDTILTIHDGYNGSALLFMNPSAPSVINVSMNAWNPKFG